MPTGPAKICIFCKQDCAGRPRMKDEHGRYACQACVDARSAQRGGQRAARRVPASAEQTVGTSMIGQKICEVCGEDCSGRPRTKDARGRYTCMRCMEELKTVSTGAAVAGAAEPVPTEDAIDLGENVDDDDGIFGLEKEAAPAAVAAAPAGLNCPACGMRFGIPNATECMRCGYNTETGKRPKAPKAPRAPRGPVQLTGAMLGIAAGCSIGGAAIGLGAWMLMALAGDISALYMALAVGAAAGTGVLIPLRGAGGWGPAAIAGGAAAVMILLGQTIAPADDVSGGVFMAGGRYVEIRGGDPRVSGAVWLAIGVIAAVGLGQTNPEAEAA